MFILQITDLTKSYGDIKVKLMTNYSDSIKKLDDFVGRCGTSHGTGIVELIGRMTKAINSGDKVSFCIGKT